MPLKLSTLGLILTLSGCCLEVAGSTSGTSTSSVAGTTGSSSGGTFDAGPFVTTLAGNGTQGFLDGTGGPNGSAEFAQPNYTAIDNAGNLYVTDQSRLRRVDPSGNVTTVAGGEMFGYADGTAGPNGTALFDGFCGVAVAADGTVYVSSGNRIRKLDPRGNVTTLAGNGTQGDADGTGGPNGGAEFNDPCGIALDATGNVYVADFGNERIRKVDPSGNVTTLAGNGMQGYADGTGGPNGAAQFYNPVSVAVDGNGNVYVADVFNFRVRRIDQSGNVTTFAGNGSPASVDGTGGPNGTAAFDFPSGVAVDGAGNVYVSEESNGPAPGGPGEEGNRIRRVDPSGNVTTLAGNGAQGYADGPGGRTGAAEFNAPAGVSVDSSGNVYVADSLSFRIRVVHP